MILIKSMYVQEVYPEVQHEAAHQDTQDRAAGRAERRRRRHPQLRPVARQRARPGSIFSRTIKLMLERQKSSIYQHVMLFECAKITPYQQDMSH